MFLTMYYTWILNFKLLFARYKSNLIVEIEMRDNKEKVKSKR